MKNVTELKHELEHGDQLMIHKMTNVPVQTVYAILGGWRNPETPSGKKVLEAAQKIIRGRKQLLASIEASELGDTPSRDVA